MSRSGMNEHTPLTAGAVAACIALALASGGWCAAEDRPAAAPELADAITLGEAMAYAINHNPQLAAAVAGVAGAEAAASAASATARPTFTLQGGAQAQSPIQQINIQLPGFERSVAITTPESARASLNVTWPLWTGGRVSAATAVSRAQANAAEGDLQQATEQLLYLVAASYYAVLSAQQQLAAAEAGVTAAAETLRTASSARGAGTASRRGGCQCGGGPRTPRARATAPQRPWTMPAGARLHMGIAPEQPVVPVADAVDIKQPAGDDEAIEIALRTRPELIALGHRIDSARAAVELARTDRNPTVAAVGAYQVQTPTDVQASHSEFIGIQFSWPVFSHPRADANQRQARAGVEQLSRTREDLERTIAVQVAEARRGLDDSRECVAAAEQASLAATQVHRRAQAAYAAGTLTRQELTGAETALAEAQARHQQALYGLSIAAVTYARALGVLRQTFLVPSEEGSRP